MAVRGFEKVSRVESLDFLLPARSTKHSAGYDFYLYEDVEIRSSWYRTIDEHSGELGLHLLTTPIFIRTGIKCYMEKDEYLGLYMRSSTPHKLGIISANSVGIIDSDYYNNPDNEGEISFMIYNLNLHPLKLKAGTKIGQGIFHKFLLADDDTVTATRSGGYGSTGN